ncbi:hypothetical protein EV06_0898 [Prochlorococcus sp. MIT 0602]|uniref:hypothetical protein n=1 Tax=unclassified Prochlorococcus TaxID=2627481 RepID=UPI000533B553|nr:hypothetical protein [Prochlorococcus sp. MIT 0602]KGG15036.1 hypothetical protein EV06_0898 [Prochlorococcus sp. MIT 0602]KGG17307.1 hypothetical protein EV07_0745 [Prochlorococcus sp. MIT 0603]
MNNQYISQEQLASEIVIGRFLLVLVLPRANKIAKNKNVIFLEIKSPFLEERL